MESPTGSKEQNLHDFLQGLRRERQELDLLIRGIETRLGVTPSEPESPTVIPDAPSAEMSIDAIPVGFFHNMSQTAAAEKLLRLSSGTPLTTRQVLDAFKRGGIEANRKNAITILYTALNRSKKFERVAGKAWGLSEWYPERKQRAEVTPKPGQRKPGRPRQETEDLGENPAVQKKEGAPLVRLTAL